MKFLGKGFQEPDQHRQTDPTKRIITLHSHVVIVINLAKSTRTQIAQITIFLLLQLQLKLKQSKEVFTKAQAIASMRIKRSLFVFTTVLLLTAILLRVNSEPSSASK